MAKTDAKIQWNAVRMRMIRFTDSTAAYMMVGSTEKVADRLVSRKIRNTL
jgi:hypothetical protein